MNSTKNFAQHQTIIIDIMISLTQSFSDFVSISLKNLLETHHHAALNENIRSACVDVKRKERQCILFQTRMKVVEHEFSFIIFDEIQSIIDDVKILQRKQNYLKMCAWYKTLFIENVTLLKDLNQAFCTSNFDYFLTWRSRASDCLESKFRKRVIAKVIKNSFVDDDFSKKRVIIFKIISLNKFSEEKKFKFIVNKNLKLFFRKLKLNFIKMNYIKDDDKLDYIMKYVKITTMHYLQQIEKTVEKKDYRITWAKFLETLQQCLLNAKLLQNQVNNLWNITIKRSDQTCVSFFLKLNKIHFQNHVKIMKFKKVLLFRFLSELLFLNKIKLIILTFAQWSKMFCWELTKYIDTQHVLNYAQQNRQLKMNLLLENWSHKKNSQSSLQRINSREKEKYFDDQQEQWESELRKTVFRKKKYHRISEKMCVRCKSKDHAKLNCLNSWFVFSETFFSEASSAFNNILIVNILKKDSAQ